MAKDLFPKGIIKVRIDGAEYLAEYVGRQEGFECCVCRKGENCYTFNILHSNDIGKYENGDYETWGFGREHLNRVQLIGVN